MNMKFSENDGKKLLRRINVGLIHTHSQWRRASTFDGLRRLCKICTPLYITDVVKIRQHVKGPKQVFTAGQDHRRYTGILNCEILIDT